MSLPRPQVTARAPHPTGAARARHRARRPWPTRPRTHLAASAARTPPQPPPGQAAPPPARPGANANPTPPQRSPPQRQQFDEPRTRIEISSACPVLSAGNRVLVPDSTPNREKSFFSPKPRIARIGLRRYAPPPAAPSGRTNRGHPPRVVTKPPHHPERAEPTATQPPLVTVGGSRSRVRVSVGAGSGLGIGPLRGLRIRGNI